MMQLIPAILLILSCVFGALNIAAHEPGQSFIVSHNNPCNRDFTIFTSDIYNPIATEENGHVFQNLLPEIHKLSFSWWISATGTRWQGKIVNKAYIAFAKNHIERFAGPDIAHPFKFFW
jgi:hypothetical protein